MNINTKDKQKNKINEISYDEHDFSQAVFDILKEYESKPQERKWFAMKKLPGMQKDINKHIELELQKQQCFPDTDGILEEYDHSIDTLVLEAKSMIASYIQHLGIKLDSTSILHELKINFRNTEENYIARNNGLGIVDINKNRFNKMEGYAKLHCLVHEFIHHVARILTKYTYDKCTYEGEFGNGENAVVENVRHAAKTGYHTSMTGRYGKQDEYGVILNEGVTEMITIRILSNHGLKYMNSPYQYNIALINNMVSYVSQKIGIESSVLYDLLIKGYFHGDYKVLKLFEKVVGKDFGEILMKENNLLDIQEQHLSLQKKGFFKKYPFMDVDIEKMIPPRRRTI